MTASIATLQDDFTRGGTLDSSLWTTSFTGFFDESISTAPNMSFEGAEIAGKASPYQGLRSVALYDATDATLYFRAAASGANDGSQGINVGVQANVAGNTDTYGAFAEFNGTDVVLYSNGGYSAATTLTAGTYYFFRLVVGSTSVTLDYSADNLTWTTIGTASDTTSDWAAGVYVSVEGYTSTATDTLTISSVNVLPAAMSSLVDPFNNSVDYSGLWLNSGGAVVDGQLTLPTNAHAEVYSADVYNLYESELVFQGISNWRVALYGDNGGDTVAWQTDGVVISSYFGTFTPASGENWYRIRETGGTTYLDSGSDGTTWTNRGSVADSALFGLSNLHVNLFANVTGQVVDIDLTDVVSEIVAQSGFAGGAVQLFWLDNGSATDTDIDVQPVRLTVQAAGYSDIVLYPSTVVEFDGTFDPNPPDTSFWVGNWSGDSENGIVLFNGLAVAPGTTIISATLSFAVTDHDGTAGLNTVIHGDLETNPTTPTTYADYASRPQTTTSAAYAPADVSAVTGATPPDALFDNFGGPNIVSASGSMSISVSVSGIASPVFASGELNISFTASGVLSDPQYDARHRTALVAEALSYGRGGQLRHGIDVLDVSGNVTDETLSFSSASVTWSYRPPDILDGQQDAVTAVRRQATVNVVGDIAFNLFARRFRLWTEIRLSDGTWNRWNLGVFVATAPTTGDDGVQITKTLNLADKSYLWSQTTLTDPVYLDASTPVVAWVTNYLSDNFGETQFAIPSSDATVGGDGLTFNSGEDVLTMLSTALSAIGYDQLTTDSEGVPLAEPLTVLTQRVPSMFYGAGKGKIVAAASVSPLLPSLPNVVRFVARQGPSSGGTEGNGIYAVYNWNTGPGSINARGGVRVSVTVQVDAADQETLVAIGDSEKQRYFAGGGEKFDGSVAINPTFGERDVVSIDLPRLDISPTDEWLVTQWTLPMGNMDQQSDALMPITAEKRVPS